MALVGPLLKALDTPPGAPLRRGRFVPHSANTKDLEEKVGGADKKVDSCGFTGASKTVLNKYKKKVKKKKKKKKKAVAQTRSSCLRTRTTFSSSDIGARVFFDAVAHKHDDSCWCNHVKWTCCHCNRDDGFAWERTA